MLSFQIKNSKFIDKKRILPYPSVDIRVFTHIELKTMVDTENENNIRWKLSSRVGLVVERLLQYKMEIVRFMSKLSLQMD